MHSPLGLRLTTIRCILSAIVLFLTAAYSTLNWYNIAVLVGLIAVFLGIMLFAVGHGQGLSNQTNATAKMTLDCVRMFYSDSWNKGYVTDLAEFCSRVER